MQVNVSREELLQILESVENTENLPDFDGAKRLLRRIWGLPPLSASMSGIEYYEPAASWIISRVKEKMASVTY